MMLLTQMIVTFYYYNVILNTRVIVIMIVIQMMVSFCNNTFLLKMQATKKTKSITGMPRECLVNKGY